MGTDEPCFENLRNPGSESVFARSRSAWVRWQKLLFLKASGAGASLLANIRRNSAHALIRRHYCIRQERFLQRISPSN